MLRSMLDLLYRFEVGKDVDAEVGIEVGTEVRIRDAIYTSEFSTERSWNLC